MKRFVSFMFCLVFSVCLLGMTVSALTESSDYLRSYNATLYSGDQRGTLKLSFNASALSSVDTLGISQIQVYKSNGTYVKTITGTSTNGLLSSGRSYLGSYTISATSGERYYLDITFIAKDSSGSDSKSLTTNVATAK